MLAKIVRIGYASEMPDFIDLQARREFFKATTTVIKPSPIDQLMTRVGPSFCRWLEAGDPRMRDWARPSLFGFSGFGHRLTKDDSPIGELLRKAIADWMNQYHFTDSWIVEQAVGPTLQMHLLDPENAEPQRWYLRGKTRPVLKKLSPRREDESDDLAYLDARQRVRDRRDEMSGVELHGRRVLADPGARRDWKWRA